MHADSESRWLADPKGNSLREILRHKSTQEQSLAQQEVSTFETFAEGIRLSKKQFHNEVSHTFHSTDVRRKEFAEVIIGLHKVQLMPMY